MRHKTILLDHGSGGLATHDLIENLLLARFKHPELSRLGDSAVLNSPGKGRLAFTTDSYVVDPIFFPGGNIGELAVFGTVNDLAMVGASPECISLGLILEEGFSVDELENVLDSIANASERAGVSIVTGDTKVVPKGKGDKVFINTSGLGLIADGVEISPAMVQPGDAVICSGTVADHGITILTCRAGISIKGDMESDTQPLHRLVRRITERYPGAVHFMRDPTRGGLGTSLWEMAQMSGVEIEIEEDAIPIKADVMAACELLGMDPLYLANEGKCIALVHNSKAEDILREMHSLPEGRDARVIGRVLDGVPGRVILKTSVGGKRLIEPLSGEPLPRIC